MSELRLCRKESDWQCRRQLVQKSPECCSRQLAVLPEYRNHGLPCQEDVRKSNNGVRAARKQRRGKETGPLTGILLGEP